MGRGKDKETARVYVARLEHLFSQLPLPARDRPVFIEDVVVQDYHRLVDELSRLLNRSLGEFKVAAGARWYRNWFVVPVRTKVNELIGYLKAEYHTENPGFWTFAGSKLRELIGEVTWRIVAMLISVTGLVLGAATLAYFKLS